MQLNYYGYHGNLNNLIKFLHACWCCKYLSDICFTKVIIMLQDNRKKILQTKQIYQILNKLAKIFDKIVKNDKIAEYLQYYIHLSPDWYRIITFGENRLIQLIQHIAEKFNVIISIMRIYDKPLYIVSCPQNIDRKQLHILRTKLIYLPFVQVYYENCTNFKNEI